VRFEVIKSDVVEDSGIPGISGSSSPRQVDPEDCDLAVLKKKAFTVYHSA